MKLHDLIKVYKGSASISIQGYCEEEQYDYYASPDEDEEDFSGDNPNGYIPSCLEMQPWYVEIKNKEVSKICIIGGGIYPVEMCIDLE